MKQQILLTATVFLFFIIDIHALGQTAETSPEPSSLVISDVTVISPERARPLAHAYVRIQAGQITAVSKKPLKGDREINGTGRYLVPGLIDTHVHLAIPPGFPSAMRAGQAAAHPDIVAAALAQDPRSFLFFGFTTVLDIIGSADRTARWNALDIRPDAYFCGGVAVIENQFRFLYYPRFSYDVPLEKRLPPVVDPARNTPEAIVARMAADGAICVKTVYENSPIPNVPDVIPTVDEGKALVKAAHALGMPVFIHANRKDAQAYAVSIGVDVIAHGMWRYPREPVALDDEGHRILDQVISDNIGYQPTTQVIIGLLDVIQKDYLSRPGVADAYPAALIDWYASKEGGWYGDGMRNAGYDVEASTRGTVARAAEVTGILAKADAHLIFGSDTPSEMIYTNPPGLNGRREMDNWIAAGVSKEKLFRALTIDNARILHLGNKIGTVEPGKIANLLLLRDDPLESVAAYDTIDTVFLHGRPIPRESLSARNKSAK